MSRRIFKIKGNFTQNGKWSVPDPGFEGKIAVGEDGIFLGWCDELYEFPPDATRVAKVRYLVGVYAENDGSIKFYKLSNDHLQIPLLYEQITVDGQKVCDWSAANLCAEPVVIFRKNGDAKIELEECFDVNDSEIELLIEEARSELSYLPGNAFLCEEVLRSGDCPNLLGADFIPEWLTQVVNPERKTFEELFGETFDSEQSECEEDNFEDLPFGIPSTASENPE